MSSQFSYDLDERHIRLMMQDAESEYDEALWNKFDSLAKVESKSSLAVGNFVSSLNMGISRSVIVPVLFIILIGGLSAMLFSFIDFRKKETVDKEIPLVANPDNIKKPEIPSIKITKPITKTQIAKVIKDTTVNIKSETLPVISNQPIKVLTPEKKKENPVNLAEDKPKEEIKTVREIKKESADKPNRKKTKKVRSEILPVINSATNLNEGVIEPELDLK